MQHYLLLAVLDIYLLKLDRAVDCIISCSEYNVKYMLGIFIRTRLGIKLAWASVEWSEVLLTD